jgi:hypothetical protein
MVRRASPNVPASRARYEEHLGNYHRLRAENQKALAAYERSAQPDPGSPRRLGVPRTALHALVDVGRPADSRTSALALRGRRRLRHHPFDEAPDGHEARRRPRSVSPGSAARSGESSRATSESRRDILRPPRSLRVAQLTRNEGPRAGNRPARQLAASRNTRRSPPSTHLLRHAQRRGRFGAAAIRRKPSAVRSRHIPRWSLAFTQPNAVAGATNRLGALQILLDTSASEEGFCIGQNGMTSPLEHGARAAGA